jgi:hypothetical protein
MASQQNEKFVQLVPESYKTEIEEKEREIECWAVGN